MKAIRNTESLPVTDRDFNMAEVYSGRGTVRPSTIVRNIISNMVNVIGDTKRPQTRGDLGVTYAVTNDFRLSNSFSYEQFDISGGSGSTLSDYKIPSRAIINSAIALVLT
jgi:hypothetical protein